MGNKMGVLGGTFDPVHMGHLIMAEYIRERFSLEKVIFMPSANPPHKKFQNVTNSSSRYDMVGLAIEDNQDFTVSDMELKRAGNSYTVDTLKELKGMYRFDPIYFIIGADVVFDLLSWRDYKNVFRMCEFIAVRRTGYNDEALQDRIKMLKNEYKAKMNLTDCPSIDISSSLIRDRVKAGRSIKYLVPPKVEEYILENRLYL